METEALSVVFPGDHGPIYTETIGHLGNFIVEPWNALSSLFLLIPAVYFLFKLKGRYRSFAFLTACIPLLFLGGTGSTLYHAFRSEPFFMYLDFYPTMFLFIAVSTFFWFKVFGQWWKAIVLVLGYSAINFFVKEFGNGITTLNILYLFRGVVFFLPLLILLIRSGFTKVMLVAGGLLLFASALVFRYVDHDAVSILPMGTHFLWHVCTGFGGLLIVEYIYWLSVNDNGKLIPSG